jgi:hypothetical protein
MPNSTLLGHLARFASFSTQSEVLCTQGLAYLLQTHEDARSAIADKIKARTGIKIENSPIWLAEAIQEDGGIPDLEARTAKGIPEVKIEAKLGAELFETQLQSYEADLRNRNSGESLLLVLVPRGRVAGISEVVTNAFGPSESGQWRLHNGSSSSVVVVSIIFWDELFAALQNGTSGLCRYELEQLQSMYQELSSDHIASLASDEDLRKWRSSDTDFVKLIDQVTRQLTKLTTQRRLYPLRVESLEEDTSPGQREYRLRYVCPCANNSGSCYSIGVRDSFEAWVTRIWMRFHRDTVNFRHIRQRIESSDLRSLESSGHVWIPMDVPRDVPGELMIQALVDQAEEILRVAFPAD